MAYSSLPAKGASDTLTLSNYNAIADNFAAGVPDIFTAKGQSAWASGSDVAVALTVAADNAELTSEAGATPGVAWQIRPGCRAYHTSAISLTANVWTTLNFNTNRWNDGVHSAASNTDRFSIPASGTGVYQIGINLSWNTSAIGVGNVGGLRVLLNGTTVIGRRVHGTDFNDLFQTTEVLDFSYPLSANDYLLFQTIVTNNTNTLASPNYSPETWVVWQRRQ